MFSIENIETTREIVIAREGALLTVLADGRGIASETFGSPADAERHAAELFETVGLDRAEVMGRGGSFPSVVLK